MKLIAHNASILQGLGLLLQWLGQMSWVVIIKSKKRQVGKNLSVCLSPGFDDTVPWSWTHVFLPITEDDSLGYHGTMKILCKPHFIAYKVIKQKGSQLPLPWEVLMMQQSECHGYCPNGESGPLSVSKQEQTLPTRGSLELLPYLGGERAHQWSRKWHFFPLQTDQDRNDTHKIVNVEQHNNDIGICSYYIDIRRVNK